jgi:lipooligosaccharide transport system permease protein
VAAHPTLRSVEREARVFRRLWRGSVFSSFLSPLLFLAAMGVGLGTLIDQHSGGAGGVDYVAFVTPGLLAATAVMVAAGESLWPILGGIKWQRTMQAMVATPIGPNDVYRGHVIWAGMRTVISATAFVIVAAPLGGVISWWGILAIPAAALTATAFSAGLAAFAATQDSDLAFPLIMRLGIIPLFLFSGTFFPISQLPAWVRPIAVCSPLWHGVELCRAATTGQGNLPALVAHVAVLAAFIGAGAVWGNRTFTRRLAA